MVEKNKRSSSLCCVRVVDVARMSRRSLEDVKTYGQRTLDAGQRSPFVYMILSFSRAKDQQPRQPTHELSGNSTQAHGGKGAHATLPNGLTGRQTAAESKFERREGAANHPSSRFSKPCLAGQEGERSGDNPPAATRPRPETTSAAKLKFAGF